MPTLESMIRTEVLENRLPRQWTKADLRHNANILSNYAISTINTDPSNRSIHHPDRPDLGNGKSYKHAYCYRVDRRIDGHKPIVYELINHNGITCNNN